MRTAAIAVAVAGSGAMSSAAQDVVISEFLADNTATFVDEDGEFSDWIEIHNGSGSARNLGGYSLTDDPGLPQKWVFPDVSLGAGARMLVFASGKDRRPVEGELHTNFSLARGGEYLALFEPGGTAPATAFAPYFPPQRENVSYGFGLAGETVVTQLAPTAYSYGIDPGDDVLQIQGSGPYTDRPVQDNLDTGDGGTSERYMWVDFSAQLGLLPAGHEVLSAELEWEGRGRKSEVIMLTEGEIGVFPVPDSEWGIQSLFPNFPSTSGGELVTYYHANPPVAEFTFSPTPTTDPPVLARFDVTSLVAQWASAPAAPQAGQVMFLNSLAPMWVRWESAGPASLRVMTTDSPGLGTQLVFFETPTPGLPNGAGFIGEVEDTKFATGRGYFTGGFTETVTSATPGATILYTTDGTEPAAGNGTAVPAPDDGTPPAASVPITATTTLRAKAVKPGWKPTNIDTQSYIFPDDVVAQSAASVPPHANWGHAGPDWEMDPEIVNHADYSATIRDDLVTLPFVSVTMDWNDLFGSGGQGIYIQGEGVERDAVMEFFVPGGMPGETFSTAGATLQVVGGSSVNRWKSDKLSMRLKFSPDLRADVFGQTGAAGRFDTLVLDARLNNVWHYGGGVDPVNQRRRAQYIHDQYVANLQLATGGTAPHGRPVFLYLNGVFWGIHTLHERPDDNFAASYLGGDPDNYDSIKHTKTNVVSGTNTNYLALLDAVSQNQTVDANYQAVLSLLDIDSFLPYILINFFVGNTDWSHHNWYASFERTSPDSLWRFHSWDAEHVMENLNENVINSGGNDTGGPEFIHHRLKANADYRMAFADAIYQHLVKPGGTLTPSAAAARYLDLLDKVDRAVVAESARWGDNQRAQPYTRNGEWLTEKNFLVNTYFPQRTGIVLNQVAGAGLYPATPPPTLTVNGTPMPEGGPADQGAQLALAPAGAGTVYFTTDGSDPRAPGGAVAGDAYDGPLTLQSSTPVKARTLNGSEWSPLVDATFLVGTPASQGDLVVSEINYHPADPSPDELAQPFVTEDADFEFLELLNVSANTIDLSGAAFVQGITLNIPVGTVMPPGARLVVVRNPQAFALRYPTADPATVLGQPYTGKLDNAGETLTLVDAAGATILTFQYNDTGGWPEDADGNGATLVYRLGQPDGDAQGHGANWTRSLADGGTPGTAEPLQSYAQWAAAEGVAGGPTGDANGDGVANAIDFAVAAGLELTPVPGQPLVRVRFTRRLAADALVTLHASHDLKAWFPADLDGPSVAGGPGDTEVVEGELPATPGTFLHLEVRLP